MFFLQYRQPGYNLLEGRGIEIGAFEHPANLSSNCNVKYCDVITQEQAQKLFPEIDASNFKHIDHIIDISTQGLSKFETTSFDFVIMNHVIEHLINLMVVIKEIYRTLKIGGRMVISAPDKDFTFDKNRPLTSFDTLLSNYKLGKTDSTIYVFLDMAKYVHPHLMLLEQEQSETHLQAFKKRTRLTKPSGQEDRAR